MLLSFPRSSRLTRPSEFRRVFERGRHRRIALQGLLVRVRESTEPQARIGFAFSKRALRHAVDRNRVKRLARESFRHYHSNLPTVDIVLIAQTEVAEMDNTAILRQLEVLWQRLGSLYPVAQTPGQSNNTP